MYALYNFIAQKSSTADVGLVQLFQFIFYMAGGGRAVHVCVLTIEKNCNRQTRPQQKYNIS